MAGHYASADVGRLLNQANLLLNRSGPGPCYASLTVTAARSQESNSKEEYLVLRAKCMNGDASAGTGG